MTRHLDLQPVIDSGMCIGCGACVHVDDSLELILDVATQAITPSHASTAEAAAVCPAMGVDFPALHEWLFAATDVGPYGVVDEVFLAQSTDADRNLRASSGGLIKEMLIELLGRPDVDGAIALTHVDGLDFQPVLLTQPDEVDTLPGSIYHALSQPQALDLLRSNEGRFVLVAIPCQLEGIYQWIRTHEPSLRERIHTTIGLLCGWQFNHHALRAICQFKGIDFDAVSDIAYRGGGPIGKLRITTGDPDTTEQQVHTIGRRVDFGYQVAFDRSFNLPRCHVCIDHSNFLADVVVGDAWLPSTVTSRTGVSLIVSRTPATTALLHDLDEGGRVTTLTVTTDEVRESQKERIAFGDFAYAYADHRRALGLHTPDMTGPNRVAASPVDPGEVKRFHAEFERKRELQAARRYRFLWWRKATVELRRHIARYVNWALVRVVKVKSLFGGRKEPDRGDMTRFR